MSIEKFIETQNNKDDIEEYSPDKEFGRFGLKIHDDFYKRTFIGVQRSVGIGVFWVKSVSFFLKKKIFLNFFLIFNFVFPDSTRKH